MAQMTNGERSELLGLVRKRERVMKTMAKERSAMLLADFETQSARIYHFDEDAVWSEAHRIAEKVMAEAQASVEARCTELGIPAEFAPALRFGWSGRGQNAFKDRRAELRKVAQSTIASLEKDAMSKIEIMSLDAQTGIVSLGMDSAAAKVFFDAMPKIEDMMPPLRATQMQNLLGMS